MKILGVGDDKYICEISWGELYEITGQNEYDEDFEVNAGDDIDLKRVVKAADWIKELDSEHINRVIKELQMALAGIEKVKSTVEALTLFNKLGDKELS